MLALIFALGASQLAVANGTAKVVTENMTWNRFMTLKNGPDLKNSGDIASDPGVNSPKSAAFSPDGKKVYINSLEGAATLVYSWPDLKKLKEIHHVFGKAETGLFQGLTTVFSYPFHQRVNEPNVFTGKPVEMAFSHGGKFLWVPYYRRSYDNFGQSPSAVAIIETRTDTIVRVMPTGPIPKYVAISSDGKWAALTHWGDNTIGLFDISSSDPAKFKEHKLLVVERKLSQGGFFGADRDKICGFCLRGTVFSPDSRYLFVARMVGNGISGFDLSEMKYMGNVSGMKSTPRHLVLTPDGKTLVMSNNVEGFLSKIEVKDLIRALGSAGGKTLTLTDWAGREVKVGSGARTVEVSNDGRTAFVAVNLSREVVTVNLEEMKVIGRVVADPFPVGLALSKDGRGLAVTSQGRRNPITQKQEGGNRVIFYKLQK